MAELTKRRFLQLAGLSLAGGVAPRGLTGEAAPTPRRSVIVVTLGAVRSRETFSPEGLGNIPTLGALRACGRFFATCVNTGDLSHAHSIAAIVTGNWGRPGAPTLFERFQKDSGRHSPDAWAVCTDRRFPALASRGANLVLPKRLLLAAAGRVANLRQLEGILNDGYEDPGRTVFPSGSELHADLRDALGRVVAAQIKGPGAPASGDELTGIVSREILRAFAPRLLLVSFADTDVAHWGSYSRYLEAIGRADRLVGMLWDEVESNARYRGRTTLLVLPELGRDGGGGPASGFRDHDSGDASCRAVWMLALGAGVTAGVTERPISPIDIAPTAARLLGVRGGGMEGKALPELS